MVASIGFLDKICQVRAAIKYVQVFVPSAVYLSSPQSHLVDGSPFQPILRRQHIHDTRATPTEVRFEDCEGGRGKRRPSLVVQTQGLE